MIETGKIFNFSLDLPKRTDIRGGTMQSHGFWNGIEPDTHYFSTSSDAMCEVVFL